MSDENVTIIKRKKVSGGGGHHGGAWKVAYADFVTAMMAFFLLMWLLNATTEKQRKGIADYFSPTIPIHKTSGGGNGPFGGQTVFAEMELPQSGRGASELSPSSEEKAKGDTGSSDSAEDNEDTKPSEELGRSSTTQDEEFEMLEGMLAANSGESDFEDPLMSHVRSKVTDEGLIIELLDTVDDPLFEPGSDAPAPKMLRILALISETLNTVTNEIALVGHAFHETPFNAENINWQLSSNRAQLARRVMTSNGVRAERIARVTGQANREPAFENSTDVRNNRLEIILLR